ncbi:hypothetical protein BS47DRAFT_1346460 [Hydnum rufescens UP504]|uniref:Uncharacterized protein n=1 Tax=Hydnum rufescens UP504 TaxID=1448309 RepID=A0A9P6DUJ2_9AGAM|nr:hypothetical protein BS47DRAFT_1346460 [Hydnum rufescens UP504]
MSKGKAASRSWADLPHEVIRIVAQDVVANHHPWTPRSWLHPGTDGQRQVWLMLMHADLMFSLQMVCRQWEAALSNSSFWWNAIRLIDPAHRHPVLAGRNNSQRSAIICPFSVYQEIINTSCVPCRLNGWFDPQAGIAESKRMEQTQWRGWVSCCHIHRPEMFCGLCLKDAIPRSPLSRADLQVDPFGRWIAPGLATNDDDRTWHNSATTCRSCRREELQGRFGRLGPTINTQAQYDLTCRVLFHQFVEQGRGDVRSVIANIEERLWLLENTRHDDYLHSHKSAVYFNRQATGAYPTGHRPDLRAEEYDVTALSPRNREALRSTALQDWSRGRIIDGCWISPLDMFQMGYPELVACVEQAIAEGYGARHPFSGDEEHELGFRFPQKEQLHYRIPGGRLYNEIQLAFEFVFRAILMPALQNCLRRLMAEADANSIDICQSVLRISIADLIGPQFLQAREMWFAEYDWTSRYPRAPSSASPSEDGSPKMESTASVSSDSRHSGSDASNERPSPATTMRTTPSPSPEPKNRELDAMDSPEPEPIIGSDDTVDLSCTVVPSQGSSRLSTGSPRSIFHGPRTPPPRLLDCVPRIPSSVDHLGQGAAQRLHELWRETIAPLFECTCGICSRSTETSPSDAEFDLEQVDLLRQAMELAEFERARDRQNAAVQSDDEFEDEEDYDDDYDEDDEDEWAPYDGEVELWSATEPVSHPTVPSPVLQGAEMTVRDARLPRMVEIIPVPQPPILTSAEVKSDPIVGGRRSRDPEDVGGPGPEIVASEADIGHGRKRLKSQ